MRCWWQGILTIILASCATLQKGEMPGPVFESGSLEASGTHDAYHADLDDLGPAPELASEVWLNVEAPLRLVDLRGKVILLDMWTFG